ncbi:transcription factor IIIA [Diachasma alloeum]|uniref:transcription factor IIIA n=1 Tax=Diachasma alloeum TaxID=454923 RepID=UPI0007382947|nr:transcription factor IIIA [Diachasma alloeum]
MGHFQQEEPEEEVSTAEDERLSEPDAELEIPKKKSGRLHKCSYDGCNASYNKPSHLERHLRNHLGEKPCKCNFPKCDKAYTTPFRLRKHQATHENFSRPFSFTENLTSEVVNPPKRPKRIHKCTYEGCGATFKKRDRLEGHIRQHNGERPFKCTVENCDKAYATNSHLKRHVLSHTSVPTTLICDICSLTLSNRQNLIRHHKRVHTSNRLYCEECDQTFRKKTNFAEHMALIHSDDSITCDKCPRKFKTSFLLAKHYRTHMKSYPCDRTDCKKVFTKFIELRRHKQNDHVNEYKCPECEKTFLSRSHVKCHLRVHSSSLIPCPYEMCHKTYNYENNLDAHIRATHLNIKVHCDICKLGFANKANVRKHIQAVHMCKVKTKTERKVRKKRRDAGRVKKSMVGKLCGLELPAKEERALLTRTPRVRLTSDTFSSPTLK